MLVADSIKTADSMKVAEEVAEKIIAAEKASDTAHDAAKTAGVMSDGLKAGESLYDASKGSLNISDFSTIIHYGKQGKHIVGQNNYIQGKSIVNVSNDKLQNLVNEYSGKGISVGNNKEIVDFGEVIGKYVDPATGKSYDTTIGTIHYSNTGVHVVPARPKNRRN